MVAGVIHLNFAVAGIDRQTTFIAKEGVARLVLAASGVGVFAQLFRPPARGRFHGLHRLHG